MIRMRARDISTFLADSIRSSLKHLPRKDLCMINIGGGTATDSINALILLTKSDPGLLSGIKIELNILDIDDYGPFFASQCIGELVSEGGALNGLDIECRHVYYDWKNVSTLETLLSERIGCIPVFSSEGGIFEYGDEGDIIRNLEIISGNVRRQTFFCGSLIKDDANVDPVFSSTIDMMKIKPKQYGVDGLTRLLDRSGWIINNFSSVNPRYFVFSLMLNKNPIIQI